MSELLDAINKAVDEAEREALRKQYEDLKAREAWHEEQGPAKRSVHAVSFEDCRSPVCRGEVPVPR